MKSKINLPTASMYRPSVIAPLFLIMVACNPITKEEQSRLRDSPPPILSMGVSKNADSKKHDLAVTQIDKEGFRDNFDRKELGPNWRTTGGNFRVESGQLKTSDAGNRGLWLRSPLPRDVRIEFKVRSEGMPGDIKVQVFGDGQSVGSNSGYIIIFGGWGNTMNIIARENEGDAKRAVGASRPVKKGHTYNIRIERRGKVIEAFADGESLARLEDPEPLWGSDKRYFAFNGWYSELSFDDLLITPL